MKQPAGFTPPPGKPAHSAMEEPDEPLDEALKESFPASDPIAVSVETHPHADKRQPEENK